MKQLLNLLPILMTITCFAQGADTIGSSGSKTSKAVSFISKINIYNATKDGLYVNGYVIKIGYEKAKALDGKTVRISGKVTVVKGIPNDANGEAVQGRAGDTRHILHPKIEVLSN